MRVPELEAHLLRTEWGDGKTSHVHCAVRPQQLWAACLFILASAGGC